MRGLVRLCADLGGGYLVHGSPAQRQLSPGAEADGRARALDFLAEAARAAEAAGVTYILEPLSPDQTNFVTTVAEAAAIVAEVGSPALRTMVDCSAAGTNETEAVADLLARHVPDGSVVHVHFNDPNRRGPGQGGARLRADRRRRCSASPTPAGSASSRSTTCPTVPAPRPAPSATSPG